MVDATSYGRGCAHCTHEAMQYWPALVGKRCVNAVVDKVAVAVGDENAEDEVFTGAGDGGLELKNAARGVLEQLSVVLEGLKDEAAMREHRRYSYQVSLLELSWLVLNLQLAHHTRVRADDLGDLSCGVGVANGDTLKGIFEGFVSNPRTLKKGRKHAISLPLCGCVKLARRCDGLANACAIGKRDCRVRGDAGKQQCRTATSLLYQVFCITPTFFVFRPPRQATKRYSYASPFAARKLQLSIGALGRSLRIANRLHRQKATIKLLSPVPLTC